MAPHFKIVRKLGEGGMGQVYLAEEGGSGRRVALKFLPPAFDARTLAALKDEVALLARLSHPALIRIYDYFPEGEEAPDFPPGPFFSMEYCEGAHLDQALKGLKAPEIVDVFARFCLGLHYLHSQGLLHRDLKPSNVLLTGAGEPKLLDFGLAGILVKGEREVPRGTAAYMPPEAFAGEYDLQSDLYSMGVVFHEALGRRPDPPPYFSELIDRLLEPEPSRRPHSALSLVKFLNRHAERPFEILKDENAEAVLQKVPWVPREEETIFRRVSSTFLILTGPTGVGRTRFLEEMKWKARLAGHGPESLRIETDLHERSLPRLQELEARLRAELRENVPGLLVLEYDADLVTPALERLLAYVRGRENLSSIVLKDLSPEATRELIRNATLDWDRPIPDEVASRIAEGSGGRPLLVLEHLREFLRRKGGAFSVPRDLAASCALRVGGLNEAAGSLLALLVVHPESLEASEAAALWRGSEDELRQARQELRTRGFLEPVERPDRRVVLAHASLKDAYRKALPAEKTVDAHRLWLKLLAARHGEPSVGPHAAVAAEHALGAGDAEAAYSWGVCALEHFSREGDPSAALAISEALLGQATDTMRRCVLYAHEGPLYYRLGLYEESLKAYDAWYALKPDDGTGVEGIKHGLYTGLVFFTWARSNQARERLLKSLQTGDSDAHAHHRPFHARSHALLARLDERDGRVEEARAHLEKAIGLAQGLPLLLGEIEQQLGSLAQSQGDRDGALRHFQTSRKRFRESGNAQAEAMAVYCLGVLDREGGRLAQALGTIEEAVALARAGGEVLQIARYRVNRALVLMDLGRYGEALSEMEEVRDAVEQYGSPEEQDLARRHREGLETLLGRGSPETLDALLDERASRHALWNDLSRLLTSAVSEGASDEQVMEVWDRIRSVEDPEARARLYRRAVLYVTERGFGHLGFCFRQAADRELNGIYENLPEEQKMDFEKRRDVRTLDQTLGELLGKSPAPGRGQIQETRFRQFCEINRKIALTGDLRPLLETVLDAAVEISRAERGFLLLKDETNRQPPVPGFEVKAARNMNREVIQDRDFEISLTLVRQAIEKGNYVLTDDAYTDPRFHEKKSVMEYRLRSILVLPLEESGSVAGAIYLDHRYEPHCFSEEDVFLLRALASQAALAIQKIRLIEELKTARDRLAGQVEEQKERIEFLSERLTQKRSDLKYGYAEIVGQSLAIMKVFQMLDHVTETAIPVWIHGESGTGKELVARSLHFNSPRKDAPFVAENVSAIPETLLESELFGHKKGAFTHADRDRTGLFEQAGGGTLFLDEVADMSLAMQAKLLRVLQEGEIRPVGSSKKVKVDVRLVTASNRNLAQMVKQGKFRQDLFFRINGLTVYLPPLRERKEDIPLLARHILKKAARELGLPASDLTDSSLQAVRGYDWPGNVRELEAVLRNALLFAKGRPITPEVLSLEARKQEASAPAPAEVIPKSGGRAPESVPEDLDERRVIVDALRQHHPDKEGAARELGVSLRTLYSWMKKYGIPKKKTMLTRYLTR